jgi:hypothetical protein
VLGRLHWWLLVPVDKLIFPRLMHRIATAAEQAVAPIGATSTNR